MCADIKPLVEHGDAGVDAYAAAFTLGSECTVCGGQRRIVLSRVGVVVGIDAAAEETADGEQFEVAETGLVDELRNEVGSLVIAAIGERVVLATACTCLLVEDGGQVMAADVEGLRRFH